MTTHSGSNMPTDSGRISCSFFIQPPKSGIRPPKPGIWPLKSGGNFRFFQFHPEKAAFSIRLTRLWWSYARKMWSYHPVFAGVSGTSPGFCGRMTRKKWVYRPICVSVNGLFKFFSFDVSNVLYCDILDLVFEKRIQKHTCFVSSRIMKKPPSLGSPWWHDN